MDFKIITKRKKLIEIEVDNKELPHALLDVFVRKGIDAYCYGPHPLLRTYRLNISTDDAVKELKDSIAEVEKNWTCFEKLLKKEIDATKNN